MAIIINLPTAAAVQLNVQTLKEKTIANATLVGTNMTSFNSTTVLQQVSPVQTTQLKFKIAKAKMDN